MSFQRNLGLDQFPADHGPECSPNRPNAAENRASAPTPGSSCRGCGEAAFGAGPSLGSLKGRFCVFMRRPNL